MHLPQNTNGGFNALTHHWELKVVPEENQAPSPRQSTSSLLSHSFWVKGAPRCASQSLTAARFLSGDPHKGQGHLCSRNTREAWSTQNKFAGGMRHSNKVVFTRERRRNCSKKLQMSASRSRTSAPAAAVAENGGWTESASSPKWPHRGLWELEATKANVQPF